MNRKIFLSILILCLLIIIAEVNGVGYSIVTVSEAKAMIDSDPSLVILDVRTPGEYDSGHIRNAQLIPVYELEDRLNELDKNDKILVYCRSGTRSSYASRVLADNGFQHVYNMLGGINEWIDKGYPVVTSADDGRAFSVDTTTLLILTTSIIIAATTVVLFIRRGKKKSSKEIETP